MSEPHEKPGESGTESATRTPTAELAATPQLIDRLYSAGVLSSSGRVAALKVVNGPLIWWPWVEKTLLFLGLALTLSGVVCFFAWNWDALPGLVKLAIVQAGIVGCCVVAWQKTIETLPGKAAITAAAVLVGVFLAVFGQVYQTGADAYQLFVGWALLILPWVVMGRFAGLWVLWLAIVNVGVSLFWEQTIDPRGIDSEWLLLILGLLNSIAAAVREFVTERSCCWLPIWFRRVTVAAALATLAAPAFSIIVNFSRAGASAWVDVVVLLMALAVVYWQFRLRKPDLFVLTCGATTITVLACAGVIRTLMKVSDESIVFFGSGLAILGIVAVMTRWLMATARDIRQQSPETRRDSGVDDGFVSTPDGLDAQQISLKELLVQLSEEGQLTEPEIDSALSIATTPEDQTPWFVQALIGFGAWLACLLFLGSLGIAGLFDNGVATTIVGVGLLAGGAFLDRFTDSAFPRQLGLAAGLTGLGLTGIGFAETTHGNEISSATIAISLATAAFYVPFRSDPFRFLSCLFSVALAAFWACDFSIFSGRGNGLSLGIHILILVETLGIGLIFTRQGQQFLRPAGYAMAVGLLGTLQVTQYASGLAEWSSVVILALAQLWILRRAWATTSNASKQDLGVAVAGTVVLGIISVPGVLASIGATLLGHLERDNVLKRLGLLFLPVYIASFYYSLETTLLFKSLVLIGSGLVLWAARWHFKRRIQTAGSNASEIQS